jgi:spore maturation protein CgeB
MRFVFYVHSLVSCWNHGNAHFLRGVMRELIRRGHNVVAMEPAGGWSRSSLMKEEGRAAIERFGRDFPELLARSYDEAFDHEAVVANADVVLVHEWTDAAVVAELGRLRRRGGSFTLLFHDTHHRAVSTADEISALDLGSYDAVLAFGATLKERYQRRGWGRQVHVWHEAADTTLFRPLPKPVRQDDLVWIGNWGDGERTEEIRAFLLEPAAQLGLGGRIHGVRYPRSAVDEIARSGLAYEGWLANADVPKVFARHRATVHIPRRPYVEALPGIPTIRMFEALACGIPLVSAPWRDVENLFRPGEDFLVARNTEEMTAALREILSYPQRAAALAASGLETILARHTCRHRVDELFAILAQSGRAATPQPGAVEAVG